MKYIYGSETPRLWYSQHYPFHPHTPMLSTSLSYSYSILIFRYSAWLFWYILRKGAKKGNVDKYFFFRLVQRSPIVSWLNFSLSPSYHPPHTFPSQCYGVYVNTFSFIRFSWNIFSLDSQFSEKNISIYFRIVFDDWINMVNLYDDNILMERKVDDSCLDYFHLFSDSQVNVMNF